MLCLTLTASGTAVDASLAELLIHRLARLEPSERHSAALRGRGALAAVGIVLPSPSVLVQHAAKVVGAVRDPETAHVRRSLPVEAARALPILEVADRLGLKLRKCGRSWRGACLIHGGDGPNLSIDPERGAFKCFVCDAGGDAISLWQQARGVEFPTAVREMATR